MELRPREDGALVDQLVLSQSRRPRPTASEAHDAALRRSIPGEVLERFRLPEVGAVLMPGAVNTAAGGEAEATVVVFRSNPGATKVRMSAETTGGLVIGPDRLDDVRLGPDGSARFRLRLQIPKEPQVNRFDFVVRISSGADRLCELARSVHLALPWVILGPFPDPEGKGVDGRWAPDRALTAWRAGAMPAPIPGRTWRVVDPAAAYTPTGFIDCARTLRTTSAGVAYLAVVLIAEDATDVMMRAGPDDAIALWLNGKRVLRDVHNLRPVRWSAQASVTVPAGESPLVAKIVQADVRRLKKAVQQYWGFFFELGSPDGTPLRLRARQWPISASRNLR